ALVLREQRREAELASEPRELEQGRHPLAERDRLLARLERQHLAIAPEVAPSSRERARPAAHRLRERREVVRGEPRPLAFRADRHEPLAVFLSIAVRTAEGTHACHRLASGIVRGILGSARTRRELSSRSSLRANRSGGTGGRARR